MSLLQLSGVVQWRYHKAKDRWVSEETYDCWL